MLKDDLELYVLEKIQVGEIRTRSLLLDKDTKRAIAFQDQQDAWNYRESNNLVEFCDIAKCTVADIKNLKIKGISFQNLQSQESV